MNDIENNNLCLKYTFDNFKVEKCNEFAHCAAMVVAKNLGNVYNPLYIYGKTGLGKTHLINAIGNKILEEHPNKNIICITSEEFMNQAIEGNNKWKDKYQKIDVLLLDDIQFMCGKKKVQSIFFDCFIHFMFEKGKQIVLTGDRPPREIFDYFPSGIGGRIELGLLAEIEETD